MLWTMEGGFRKMKREKDRMLICISLDLSRIGCIGVWDWSLIVFCFDSYCVPILVHDSSEESV